MARVKSGLCNRRRGKHVFPYRHQQNCYTRTSFSACLRSSENAEKCV